MAAMQRLPLRLANTTFCRCITTKQLLGRNPPLSPASPESVRFDPRPVERARYEDYYHDVLAPDLLAMTFTMKTKDQPVSTRTNEPRAWDGTSPYHKNRPNRPLRGGKVPQPLPETRTHRNVPRVEAIYVHSMVKEALLDRSKLLSAFMAFQTITGQRPELIESKKSVAPWKLREGVAVAVQVKLQGPPMMQFLATLIEVILPSLKDFGGVAESTGDGNGNIAFGLPPAALSRFPEIEANYEQYPHLPGCHIMINTSALNDREAKLLLTGFGLPFKQ